ncbi:hypothetical protein BT93_A0265 [Corymbia citriodora subsp. variegata]|nr:hypothetical protein BT93_A0265 [Corymbia citriodora subsp. variegata]
MNDANLGKRQHKLQLFVDFMLELGCFTIQWIPTIVHWVIVAS